MPKGVYAHKRADVSERLWRHIEPEPMSGCWLWVACRHSSGYGIIRVAGRAERAHRVMYELLVGVIPDDQELDHLCRVRACVNPGHVEPVAHQENCRRGIWPNALKTHCPQGHAFTEANTRINVRGSRECRECHRQQSLAYLRRRSAA